jgi:hypothetical protein
MLAVEGSSRRLEAWGFYLYLSRSFLPAAAREQAANRRRHDEEGPVGPGAARSGGAPEPWRLPPSPIEISLAA